MKHSILFSIVISVLFLFSAHRSAAQSAVYYCPDMGAIGYAYSNDDNGNDLKLLEKQAKISCEEHGGKHPSLLYRSNKLGWGGIIKGRDVTGAPLVLAVGHEQSDKRVRNELRRKYLARDGVEYDDVLVITWRAE